MSQGVTTISESQAGPAHADLVLAGLLRQTSRTFALAIPCLPAGASREVTIAYLLFRIADTIEDADRLDRVEKLAALDKLASVIRGERPADLVSLAFPRSPSSNADYLTLLQELPLVMGSLRQLRIAGRLLVSDSVLASLAGMRRFIASGSRAGHIQVQSVEELRDYCYIVAGVVGEMLTEIFIERADSLKSVGDQLRQRARWFGEGLQLVNILKDSDEDGQDGRVFIPAGVKRHELARMAREDLRQAEDYVRVLKQAKAPAGFIAFSELPLLLAWRTLDCVEQFGPGSKVPRSEVLSILAQTHAAAAERDSRGPIKKAAAR